MENSLPPIPAKRYFTIGEVSELCGVKPHVLRYWEQEFSQLRPMKRRGNRRYYQHHEVLMIRRIRDLLYDQGFTISGARNKLVDLAHTPREPRQERQAGQDASEPGAAQSMRSHPDHPAIGDEDLDEDFRESAPSRLDLMQPNGADHARLQQVRRELFEIRDLLSPA